MRRSPNSVTPHFKRILADWGEARKHSFDERTPPMIIEMRTYKTKPGKREEFLAIFTTKSLPAHREIGMKIIGPFLSIEDADTFFFMRGFPNLESRGPMRDRFYEGELWKTELEHTLLPMLEKYDVVLVEADENLGGWH
jgi:hypothetical protein